jgi:hypothetical protein
MLVVLALCRCQSEVINPAAAAAICCLCHLLLLLLLQLMHEVWPEGLYEPLQQVIDIARLAASLQPDGTGMPEVCCCCYITKYNNIYNSICVSEFMSFWCCCCCCCRCCSTGGTRCIAVRLWSLILLLLAVPLQ